MKRRVKSRWSFLCAQCGGELKTIFTSLVSAWNCAQRQGWRFEKTGPVALHFCSKNCRDLYHARQS